MISRVLLTFAVLIAVLGICYSADLNESSFDFEMSLTDAGLIEKLRHPHPFAVKNLEPDKCHQYRVHVQRWVDEHTRYPVGIACRCDWVMSPNVFYGTTMEPRVVFVATAALITFSTLLDNLKYPVVLISAINDYTIPVNYDVRVGMPEGFTLDPEKGLWVKILHHPMIIHWFLENHSQVNNTKVSTLPIMFTSKTGTTEPDEAFEQLHQVYINAPPWQVRPTLLLSSDRVRDGKGQWHDRAVLHRLCEASPLCTVPYSTSHDNIQNQKEQDEKGFAEHVSNSRFLIMAHGGGLDPCPKLVHSIVLGAIPIIQSNALDDAYEQLPVVIVPSLRDFLHPNNTAKAEVLLKDWGVKYGPYYEPHSDLRKETLHKLSEEYWWNQVVKYKQL